MKNARAYMKEICKALTSWEDWLQDGESMIKAGDKQLLLRLIEHQTAQLQRLDSLDVKDDLLEHEDGVAMRLKRLENDYKLLATARHIGATKDTPAQTTDAEVNAAIDRCRQVIEKKTWEIITVYNECELIKPEVHEELTDIPTKVRELFATYEDCLNFFEDGDSLDCAGWARRAFKYRDKLYFHVKGDKSNLYEEIRRRHPKIAGLGTFTHTLNDLNNGTLK